MSTRKILLILTEGVNDRTALSVMTTLYPPQNFAIRITNGDVTSSFDSIRTNIKEKVAAHIKEYLKVSRLKSSDIIEVWLITDTDGTYISDSRIIEDSEHKKFYYEDNCIRTALPDNAKIRNKRKSKNLNELLKTKQLINIPFKIFFMSCNLDHVIANKANCEEDEKYENADNFAAYYGDQNKKEEFENFFKKISPSNIEPLNYKDSWKFIEQECNSLKRYSNFYLALQNLDRSLAS